MVTSVLLCVLYQSDFSKVADPHREQVTLGQICQKGRLFFEKKRSDRAQVHLFAVSMCQITSRTIAVERHSAQKLHSSTITLLLMYFHW